MKSKILELMYSWTLGLPHEVKITEAYQMLKKQGERSFLSSENNASHIHLYVLVLKNTACQIGYSVMVCKIQAQFQSS